MCSHQTFSPISMNCISHFFRSYEPYFILCTFFKEEYKVRSVPSFCVVFIHNIKLFCRLDPGKMLYFANDRCPKRKLKTYTASLFLPLARLAEIIFLPFFVFILVLNPCVLFLGVLCGWYVLFILNHP